LTGNALPLLVTYGVSSLSVSGLPTNRQSGLPSMVSDSSFYVPEKSMISGRSSFGEPQGDGAPVLDLVLLFVIIREDDLQGFAGLEAVVNIRFHQAPLFGIFKAANRIPDRRPP
jgi:hypothetical protein